MLLTWISALPEELVRRRPLLCITQAWALTFAGKLDDVESLLQAAEGHTRSGEGGPAKVRFVVGNTATIVLGRALEPAPT